MVKKPYLSARELCVMALLTVVLFLQEELLAFLPNIQLTVFLILLYAKLLGFGKCAMVVTVYVLLDSAYMGTLNPLMVGFQWLGWLLIPLGTALFLKTTEDNVKLALAAALFALLYSWVMIVPGCLLLGVTAKAYLAADLVFEILLAASSFLSVLLLYAPLSKLLRRLLRQEG